MTPTEKEAINSILCNFLQQMDFSFQTIPISAAYADAAVEDGIQHHSLRKEDTDTAKFRIALQTGSAITLTMYNHLDIRTQYWTTLFTTYVTLLDDLSASDPAPLREFHPRFIYAESQKHPLLDCLAILLRKAREHFNPPVANLIVSSTLDFVTAHILEYDYKSMKIHKSASGYPRFFRTLSGLATPFVVFAFPPHMSLGDYIQALPNAVNFINDANDVLSFYKEQLVNEDANHVSLLADMQGWTKLQALQYLADLIVDGNRATKEILSGNPEACEIYVKGVVFGYIAFHFSASERYKLNDLELAA